MDCNEQAISRVDCVNNCITLSWFAHGCIPSAIRNPSQGQTLKALRTIM